MRGTGDWFLDGQHWLWCELSVPDRLVPVNVAGIVAVCFCNGSGVLSREIGTEENGKVVSDDARSPEDIGIKGHGCSS